MTDFYFFCVQFTVEGSGPFPLKMLAMDRCCPEKAVDAEALMATSPRQVNLLRFSMAGKGNLWGPFARGTTISKMFSPQRTKLESSLKLTSEPGKTTRAPKSLGYHYVPARRPQRPALFF